MQKLKFLLIFLNLITISSFSQNGKLNSYKYVIISTKYDFQKNEHSYKINALTKFLFEKEGFIALLNDENLPEELTQNRCLALIVKLNSEKKFFSTNMSIDLFDCNNQLVLSTTPKNTKIKEYEKAYHTVIRETFKDISKLNYEYNAVEQEKNVEVKVPKVEKETVFTPTITVTKSVVTPKIATISEIKNASTVLYAQAIENGFQLVDSSPKVIYILQKTSKNNVFILKNKNGLFFKENNNWIAEYYVENQLIREELEVKF